MREFDSVFVRSLSFVFAVVVLLLKYQPTLVGKMSANDRALSLGQEVSTRDDLSRREELSCREDLDRSPSQSEVSNPNLVLFVRCVGVSEDKSTPLRRALFDFLVADGWAAPRLSTSQVFYRNVGESNIEVVAEAANDRLRNVISEFRSRPSLSLIGDWHISYVFMKPILVGQHSPNLMLADFSFNPGPLQKAGSSSVAVPAADTDLSTTNSDGAVAAQEDAGVANPTATAAAAASAAGN